MKILVPAGTTVWGEGRDPHFAMCEIQTVRAWVGDGLETTKHAAGLPVFKVLLPRSEKWECFYVHKNVCTIL